MSDVRNISHVGALPCLKQTKQSAARWRRRRKRFLNMRKDHGCSARRVAPGDATRTLELPDNMNLARCTQVSRQERVAFNAYGHDADAAIGFLETCSLHFNRAHYLSRCEWNQLAHAENGTTPYMTLKEANRLVHALNNDSNMFTQEEVFAKRTSTHVRKDRCQARTLDLHQCSRKYVNCSGVCRQHAGTNVLKHGRHGQPTSSWMKEEFLTRIEERSSRPSRFNWYSCASMMRFISEL